MRRLLIVGLLAFTCVQAAPAARPLEKMNARQLEREAARSRMVVGFFARHPYGRYAAAFRHRTCLTVRRSRRGRCFYARNRARWHQERLTTIERMLTPAAPAVTLGPLDCLSCWDRVAYCETGGTMDWSISTGNGFYGGLQWLLSTWHAYGGGRYASNPVYATRMQQISVASRMSLSHWPTCGARY